MYTCIRPVQLPKLKFQVRQIVGGPLAVSAAIPQELEPKIMVAMRNALWKKYFKDGTLEILLPCLTNTTPEERNKKVEAFCKWLSRRSGVAVTAIM